MTQHSVLAPSSAHRRLRCAASLAASKDIPNLPNSFSAEGTAYHKLAERVLRGELTSCEAAVGETVEADGFKFVIDEENARHAQTYVDAVRRIPGELKIEQRVDTSEVVGVEDQGGTVDTIVLDYDHDTLHVVDLKFGRGEAVDAFDNEQLLEYGAAALLKYEMLHDWKFLRIAIHQPRLNHFPDMTYATDKVWEWVAHVKPLEQLAYRLWQDPSKLDARHFTPSAKGCRWCPIRNTCAARTKQQLAEFPIEEPPKQAIHLSLAELGEARDRVDAIEAWCKDIKEEAHVRAMRGDAIPGWKLVEGRMGNRKLDPNAETQEGVKAVSDIEATVGDEAYEDPKLKSAAELDKMLNAKKHPEYEKRKALWDRLQAAITQTPPSLSLERASVDKPAVSRSMAEFPLQEPAA